jgi:4-oxalocrotonate tautomerase
MPIVQVQMLRGRSAAQKRRLIAELTRVTAEVAEVSPERVNVVILEVEAESWGRGGEPLSDEPVATEAGTRAAR